MVFDLKVQTILPQYCRSIMSLIGRVLQWRQKHQSHQMKCLPYLTHSQQLVLTEPNDFGMRVQGQHHHMVHALWLERIQYLIRVRMVVIELLRLFHHKNFLEQGSLKVIDDFFHLASTNLKTCKLFASRID